MLQRLKNSNNSVYVIEKLDSELEFEWVILAVMHMDMAVFSRVRVEDPLRQDKMKYIPILL